MGVERKIESMSDGDTTLADSDGGWSDSSSCGSPHLSENNSRQSKNNFVSVSEREINCIKVIETKSMRDTKYHGNILKYSWFWTFLFSTLFNYLVFVFLQCGLIFLVLVFGEQWMQTAGWMYLLQIFLLRHYLSHGISYGDLLPSAREFVRESWLLKHLAAYFPVTLHKTAELDPAKRYLFGVHPHGIFSFTMQTTFASNGAGFDELFPGVQTHCLVLSKMFEVPISRELPLFASVYSASKKTFKYIFGNPSCKKSLALTPGGAQESLYAVCRGDVSKTKLCLKNRKGFVKVALRYKVDLVPIFSFGENDLFNGVNTGDSWMGWIQNILKKSIGFTIPVFWGRPPFITLPKQRNLNVYVGAAIDCSSSCSDSEPTKEPTNEEIDAKHREYCKALLALFERFKAEEGYPNMQLEFA